MSALGKLIVRPGLSAAKKLTEAQAEKAMKRPFYSTVDRAIEDIVGKQPKGTGDQYLGMILKTKGVKPAEVRDRGLDVALRGKGKTTGADLQKLADENPPPQVKERVLDDTQIDYDDDAERAVITNPTHYGEEYADYRTPGGENYREVLFRLPEPKSEQVKPMTLAELQQKGYTVGNFQYNRHTDRSLYKIYDPNGNFVSQSSGSYGVSTPEQALIKYGQSKAELEAKQSNKKNVFKADHFGDEGKQLLAHARVQDMTGPNGEKIMLIDEIQSDWHQRGRKKGYSNPEERQYIVDKLARNEELTPEEDALRLKYLKQDMPPDAPFKKNWHELVMKRLVDDAAKGGYDRVIITPGAEQALRYEKPELIKGMQSFYDQILPNYIKNQYGVEVGQHPLSLREFDVVTGNGGEGFAVVPKGSGRTIAKYPTMEEARAAADQMSNVNYHSFDITPEMRESITTQGQAFYQLAPVAGAVGAGMMATDEEPTQYKKGGVARKQVSMDAMRLATLNKQRKRKHG